MANTEAKRLYDIEYRKRNKEKISIRMKQYYIDNKEAIDSRNNEWDRNTDRSEYSKKWYQENKERISERISANRAGPNATSARRRAIKLNATPSWSNKEEIKWIYAMCPKGYEVDHIIPLKGKNVCGLHTESNLQYLTPTENRRKGNRFE